VLVSILIIVTSLALCLYWFRYACKLILSTGVAEDCRAEVAAANQLSFFQIQQTLNNASVTSFDALKKSLLRDYALVHYMRRNSAAGESDGAVEDCMLRLNFHLLSVSYAAVKLVSARRTRVVLDEMSQVVGYFANNFGQRAAGMAA